ncbi:Rho-associated protein kinase, putative [Pediculus humanus corporis]|uniref:Rho-associated protein kinase, putative n=1 Tax=Pediculus humanus subsp. corporis TaxID=121224 RepID=E0VF35_PEDHC|nr:Rho-associated protein kinase, putative [Pediculus humanus corporis]EEB11924.1 Rho-associated protein kinase, putative [Pediculus humanus corporis]
MNDNILECRQKLQLEILEHKKTKTNLLKIENENKELQIQLDVSLKATQNLEKENNKNREILVKLQIQTTSYLNERQQLIDKCFYAEVCKIRQNQTEALVAEILNKQEILKKEHNQLKSECNESLAFITKIENEADMQVKYVLEANKTLLEMEEKMILLMAALEKEKFKNKDLETLSEEKERNSLNSDEWKNYQTDNQIRINKILEENEFLTKELNLATSQIELK